MIRREMEPESPPGEPKVLDRINRGEGDRSFDVDGMLGRLAKWLRILGLDAAFPRSVPSEGRIFVTMKRDVRFPECVKITSNAPMEQLVEFLEQTGIRPDPARVLTRCVICNVPVEEISRERVVGRVPDRILDTITSFNECPRCGRVYWEGSHGDRIRRRLGDIQVRTDSTGVDSSVAD